jgi:hypothetical protein
MQRCIHDDWFQKYEDDALFMVKGRFFHPGLRLFRESIAGTGVARTGEIANYLCQFDAYFTGELQFRRWLNTISYREALRVVLQQEPIEAALEELLASDRAVLRWSYVEQITLDDVARLLERQSNNRFYFDKASARDRIIDAYKQLCRILLRRFRPADNDEAERFNDCSRIFPSPPTLSGNFDITITLE